MKNPSCPVRLKGFTLIEILIVVAIIGILVAMSIPNFLRMRLNANEGLGRGDLRAFSTASENYRTLQSPPTYAPTIATLIAQNYLDSTWVNPGNKHGYHFTYALDAARTFYSLEANALTPSVTGSNCYCVDQTGLIVVGPVAGLGTTTGCVGGTPLGA